MPCCSWEMLLRLENWHTDRFNPHRTFMILLQMSQPVVIMWHLWASLCCPGIVGMERQAFGKIERHINTKTDTRVISAIWTTWQSGATMCNNRCCQHFRCLCGGENVLDLLCLKHRRSWHHSPQYSMLPCWSLAANLRAVWLRSALVLSAREVEREYFQAELEAMAYLGFHFLLCVRIGSTWCRWQQVESWDSLITSPRGAWSFRLTPWATWI